MINGVFLAILCFLENMPLKPTGFDVLRVNTFFKPGVSRYLEYCKQGTPVKESLLLVSFLCINKGSNQSIQVGALTY